MLSLIFYFIFLSACISTKLSWRAHQADQELPFPEHHSASRFHPSRRDRTIRDLPASPQPKNAPPRRFQEGGSSASGLDRSAATTPAAAAATPAAAAAVPPQPAPPPPKMSPPAFPPLLPTPHMPAHMQMPIPPPPSIPPPPDVGVGMHLVGQAQVNSFASQSYGQGMFQMSAYLLQTLAREFGSQLRGVPQLAITAPQPAAEPAGPPPAAAPPPATPAGTAASASETTESLSSDGEDEDEESTEEESPGESDGEDEEEEAQTQKGRGKGKQQARLCACYVLACMHACTHMHACYVRIIISNIELWEHHSNQKKTSPGNWSTTNWSRTSWHLQRANCESGAAYAPIACYCKVARQAQASFEATSWVERQAQASFEATSWRWSWPWWRRSWWRRSWSRKRS